MSSSHPHHSSTLAKRCGAIPLSGIRIIFEKALGMKDVVRLEVGEPDFDTPQHIKEAARRALEEGFTHYTSSSGIEELRAAIAERLKIDDGLDVEPDRELVVTAGASSAIYLAMLCLVEEGDEVLLPDPAWPHYEPCVLAAGGRVIRYSLTEEEGFLPSLEELQSKLRDRTKLLVLNFPNNPTGSLIEEDRLRGIGELCAQVGAWILEDRVYDRLVYEGSCPTLAKRWEFRDRVVIINSLSKTYAMTGWRVGYAMAPEELVREMVKLNLYINTCANSISQKAAVAALLGPQDCVRAMRDEYRKRREAMLEGLNSIPGIRCRKPQGAFYAFPNVKGLGLSSYDLSLRLLEEARVATVPGAAFGKMGEGFVRISYSASLDAIAEGLRRIRGFVEGLRIGSNGSK